MSVFGLQKADLVQAETSGQLHAHYEILEELGHGSYGAVLRAKEKHTGDVRVCKEVTTAGMGAQEVQLMKLEIDVLRRVEHPYVVQLMDYAEDQQAGKIFLIQELLSGGDCSDLIKKHGSSLNEKLVAKCIKHLILGTAYCHSQGILHRDIKPENMMLTEKNDPEGSDVKVIDFGLAKVVAGGAHKIEKDGVIVGTPPYMAPELVSGQPFGDPVDYWSIGVSTYEMLTGGNLPFGQGPADFGGDFQAYIRHLQTHEPDWEEGWENRSAYALDFTQRLLEKDPALRMGISEAIKHPWLRKYAPAEHENSSALTGFAGFSEAPHFAQACCLLIAAHLGQKELRTVAQEFEALDTEGQGSIPVDDLAEALLARQWFFNRDEDFAYQCAQHADLNGDGTVSFTEFAAASIHSRLRDEDLAEHAFDLFDKDADGLITPEDIKFTLETPHVKAFEEQSGIDYLDLVRPLQNREQLDFMAFRKLLEGTVPSHGVGGVKVNRGAKTRELALFPATEEQAGMPATIKTPPESTGKRKGGFFSCNNTCTCEDEYEVEEDSDAENGGIFFPGVPGIQNVTAK